MRGRTVAWLLFGLGVAALLVAPWTSPQLPVAVKVGADGGVLIGTAVIVCAITAWRNAT